MTVHYREDRYRGVRYPDAPTGILPSKVPYRFAKNSALGHERRAPQYRQISQSSVIQYS
jgi:hypothetical protein